MIDQIETLEEIFRSGERIPSDLIEEILSLDKEKEYHVSSVSGIYETFTIYLPSGESFDYRRLTNL